MVVAVDPQQAGTDVTQLYTVRYTEDDEVEERVQLAVSATAVLLHPSPPSVGVLTAVERGCQ